MSGVLGIDSWGLPLVGLIVIGLVIVAWRMVSRRREADDVEPSRVEPSGRLAMLESTAIDETRRLVLVRCDKVEHLIMVGGPVDLVVENDVRKSRVPKRAAGPAAGELVEHRPAAVPEPARIPAGPAAAAAPRPAEAVPPRPAEEDRPQKLRAPEAPERPSRPNLTPVPAATRNGHAAPTPAVRPVAGSDEKPRAPLIGMPRSGEPKGQPRPVPENLRVAPSPEPLRPDDDRPRGRVVDRLFGRREPVIAAPLPEAPTAPGARAPERPLPENRAGEAGRDVPATQERRDTAAPSPAADLDASMPDDDSIEGEIVRALRSTDDGSSAARTGQRPADPLIPAQQAAHPKPAATRADAKPGAGPATTLGDLAERLEEALAREVRAANQNRSQSGPDLEAFKFEPAASASAEEAPDRDDAVAEPAPPMQQNAPTAEREAPAIAAVPEADRREPRLHAERPNAERQEEAPVINLHARRREPADPLEDEMARLLGELTGDSKSR